MSTPKRFEQTVSVGVAPTEVYVGSADLVEVANTGTWDAIIITQAGAERRLRPADPPLFIQGPRLRISGAAAPALDPHITPGTSATVSVRSTFFDESDEPDLRGTFLS